jgi:hypothetical protein
MGNKLTAIYEDIVSDFERMSHLVVIRSSESKSAKVYSKTFLEKPITKECLYSVKNGTPILQEMTNFDVLQEILSNFENQKRTIEYYDSNCSIDTNLLKLQLDRELRVPPSFKEDGIYTVNFTIIPYISMRPGSYKVMYHMNCDKNKVPPQSISEQEPPPQIPDSYGKL